MISFILDCKQVEAESGETILEVAKRYNIYIPGLCHHPALKPAGCCHLCSVEVHDGQQIKVIASCNYEVRDGLDVRTDSEEAVRVRNKFMEKYLARCPNIRLLKN